MYDSETLESLLLNLNLKGLYELLFVDGETRTLDIDWLVYNIHGDPIYFTVEDGTVYIWARVISIKKVG